MPEQTNNQTNNNQEDKMDNQTNNNPMIDLIEIAEKLAQGSEKVRDKAKNTTVYIKGSNLCKHPEYGSSFESLRDIGFIAVVGKETGKHHTYSSHTLTAYNHDGKVVVAQQDQNATITDQLWVKSFQVGLGVEKFLILTDGKSDFKVDFKTSSKTRSAIAETEDNVLNGTGKDLNPDWLFTKPSPEHPLHTLNPEHTYEIVGNGKFTNKYHTPMYAVKSKETGEVIEGVVANSSLRNYFKKYGIGFTFKIGDITHDKNGNHKVAINNLSIDFDDSNFLL